MLDTVDVTGLLVVLRRGPGLRDAVALRALLRDGLRELFGPAGAPPKLGEVVARLTGVIALLPELQRLVATVEFGLHDGYRQDFLLDRQAQLANDLNCSTKTVQRHGIRAVENIALHLQGLTGQGEVPHEDDAVGHRLWSFPPGPIVAVTGEIRLPAVEAQPGLFLLQSRDSLAMVEAVVSVVTTTKTNDLVLTSCGSVRQDHLTANLVLVGGPRSNTVVRRVLAELDVPVRISITRHPDGTKTKRIVLPDGHELAPGFDDGSLTRDLALVVVGRNPFETSRKIVLFAGLHSHGNHGAVVALASHGNPGVVRRSLAAIAAKRADDRDLALVVEVPVVNGEIVQPGTRPEWVYSF